MGNKYAMGPSPEQLCFMPEMIKCFHKPLGAGAHVKDSVATGRPLQREKKSSRIMDASLEGRARSQRDMENPAGSRTGNNHALVKFTRPHPVLRTVELSEVRCKSPTYQVSDPSVGR